jgi:SagB-type dehydrogenase family enzyme
MGGGDVARRFHDGTKHSFESIRTRAHYLDWANKPHPFKRYREELPRHPLPADPLGRILRVGAGVHHVLRYGPEDETHFRTYASAGALYPVEVYVADSSGLSHFDPSGPELVVLREGDHRPYLVRAAGEGAVAADSIVVLTGIPWRTAWKYTERGYRHLFWDAGMILANMLALASEGELPAQAITGFVEAEVEALLGLDGVQEFPLCLLGFGEGELIEPASGVAAALDLHPEPLSAQELAFEGIREVNDAGRLDSPEAVVRWRAAWDRKRLEPEPENELPLPTSVEEAIQRRGSARRFGPRPMPVETLHAILTSGYVRVPMDLDPAGLRIIEPDVVVNNVDGLDRGVYVWRDGELHLLVDGDLRREAGYLSLEQALGATSAATVFLMANLEAILDRLGDRGYRVANLAAGISGGWMYVAAYARGFGATGLTFYDDDVVRAFSPDAKGKSCLLVVAVGDSPRLRRDLSSSID